MYRHGAQLVPDDRACQCAYYNTPHSGKDAVPPKSGSADFAPRQLFLQKIQRPLTRWLLCTNMSVGFAGIAVNLLLKGIQYATDCASLATSC